MTSKEYRLAVNREAIRGNLGQESIEAIARPLEMALILDKTSEGLGLDKLLSVASAMHHIWHSSIPFLCRCTLFRLNSALRVTQRHQETMLSLFYCSINRAYCQYAIMLMNETVNYHLFCRAGGDFGLIFAEGDSERCCVVEMCPVRPVGGICLGVDCLCFWLYVAARRAAWCECAQKTRCPGLPAADQEFEAADRAWK